MMSRFRSIRTTRRHSRLEVLIKMKSSAHLLLRSLIVVVAAFSLSGCITARMQDNREGVTGIAEGEAVVIMARS